MKSFENRRRYIGFTAAVLLFFALLYALWQCAAPYDNLRENVFRLHILANSDDIGDQNLKLAVRDDILPLAKQLFGKMDVTQYDGNTYAEQTANAVRDSLGILSAAAQQAVYAHGSTQTAAVAIGYEPFPEKRYEDIVMPAGNYWCLRVILGAGKGQNWWCVLYPPLCISPASAKEQFDAAELDLLHQPEQYRFRLAILEWMDALKRRGRK